MSANDRYQSGAGLWAAMKQRAKMVAQDHQKSTSEIMRLFVFSRFLARVFHDPASPWVLKGGTAVLARVQDARTTKDVDLLRQVADIESAVEALRDVADLDLDDHFRFVVLAVQQSLGGPGQPTVDGRRVTIESYCGASSVGQFGVDLVTGSLMTSAPEVRTLRGLNLKGIVDPTMRLYPIVDHVADKLCATQAMYGENRDQESSRPRDLVDLVVFIETQQIDGSALTAAIQGEWAHRELPGVPFFAPPSGWKTVYQKLARDVPACSNARRFEDATLLLNSFFQPVFDANVAGKVWEIDVRGWR